MDELSKKILHLGDMAFVGYNLVKLLRQNGIDADYLAYYDKNFANSSEPWMYYFNSLPLEPFNKIKLINQSLSVIKRYDIIHAHSIFAVPLLVSKKPFILHLHGTDVRQYAKELSLLGFSIKALIREANQIVVSTPDLLKEVSQYERDAIFLPNPVNFNIFRPCPPKFDLHNGVDFVIFHPSSHGITKNNHILIKSFYNLIKDGYKAKLIMMEWGDYRLSKELIDKLNISKYIFWQKPIPNERMADYYNACDLVVDQFFIGGLCLVSLEAMACAKPTITKFDLHDILCGYPSPPPIKSCTNEREVGLQLVHFLEDNEHRIRTGRECLSWVKKAHSCENINRILSNIYRDL